METSIKYDLYGQAERLDALFADERDFFDQFGPSEEELDRMMQARLRNLDRLGAASIIVLAASLIVLTSFIAQQIAPDLWQFHAFA